MSSPTIGDVSRSRLWPRAWRIRPALLLFFARHSEPAHLRAADQIAERIRGIMADGTSTADPGGLTDGASGAALFMAHLYRMTGDAKLLDTAIECVRRDLRNCVGFNGSLQLNDGWRTVSYLGAGPSGIGIAALEFLRHRDEADPRAAVDGIHRGIDHLAPLLGLSPASAA